MSITRSGEASISKEAICRVAAQVGRRPLRRLAAAAGASSSVVFASHFAAAQNPSPNGLTDIQVGETAGVFRIAFICRDSCPVEVSSDGGILLHGIATDMRVDLSSRTTAARTLSLAPAVSGGAASRVSVDGGTALGTPSAYSCVVDGFDASCIDFDRQTTAAVPTPPSPRRMERADDIAAVPPEGPAPYLGAALAPSPEVKDAVPPTLSVSAPERLPPPERLSPPSAGSEDRTENALSISDDPLASDAQAALEADDTSSKTSPPSPSGVALRDTPADSLTVDPPLSPATEAAPEQAPAIKEPISTGDDDLATESNPVGVGARSSDIEPTAAGDSSPPPATKVSSVLTPPSPRLKRPLNPLEPPNPSGLIDATMADAGAPPEEDLDSPAAPAAANEAPPLASVSDGQRAGLKAAAEAIFNQQFDDLACAEAADALQNDPWALDAMVDGAFCKVIAGDVAGAEADFSRLLAYTPDNYRALVGQALIFAVQGDRGGALRTFQAALDALPPIAESNRIVDAMEAL